MRKKDYYAILGIGRNAGEDEIRRAYRRLALRSHPDTNRDDPMAEERFKEINEAYDVLSNIEKRNRYDLGPGPFIGDSPFRPFNCDHASGHFEDDFLSQFRCRGGGFGRILGRKKQSFPARSVNPMPDLHIRDLPLSPAEASTGTERDIRLHTERGMQVFTVSIPPGAGNGSLCSFKCTIGGGQEIELLFRVRITG